MPRRKSNAASARARIMGSISSAPSARRRSLAVGVPTARVARVAPSAVQASTLATRAPRLLMGKGFFGDVWNGIKKVGSAMAVPVGTALGGPLGAAGAAVLRKTLGMGKKRRSKRKA